MGVGGFPTWILLVRFKSNESLGQTDQELELALILRPGTPSCADVAILLLEGLEHELEGLLPGVNTAGDREDESFCDGHCEDCWFVEIVLYRTIKKIEKIQLKA